MRNSSLIGINNRSQADTSPYGLQQLSGSIGSISGGAVPLPDAPVSHEEEKKLLEEVRMNKAKKKQELMVKEEEALWRAKNLAN